MTYKDEQGNKREMSESAIQYMIDLTFKIEEQEPLVLRNGPILIPNGICLN